MTRTTSRRSWPRTMLSGGMAGALLCSVPAAVGGLVAAGADGLLGWALALVVVGGCLAVGVAWNARALRAPSARALGPVLVGFVVRVALVLLAMRGLAAAGWLAGHGRVDWFAWTTVALVCGWSGGIIRVLRRTRNYVYDCDGAEGDADEC